MEPFTFFIFAILFWVPSIVLLIAGLLSFKLKTLKKILLILSLICFLIPWLLVLGTRIYDTLLISSFEGTYYGTDSRSNKITVEIREDKNFTITVENCEAANISGWWQYVSEYDACLFHADHLQITISENYRDELILNSDLITICSELEDVKLEKE